jgi:hypothetical protein
MGCVAAGAVVPPCAAVFIIGQLVVVAAVSVVADCIIRQHGAAPPDICIIRGGVCVAGR